MSQSRRMSAIESIVNVFIGYWIAVAAQIVIFPMFHVSVTLSDNLGIGGCFTAVSLVRSYILRRLFNGWRS